MEKPVIKAKNKFLAFLPKAAKAAAAMRFEFENPLFSPGKDKRAATNAANKHKPSQNRGYSGPITSQILEEARNKSKNSRFEQAKEPTSPKISCMGQIKHKKKINQKAKHVSALPRDHSKPFLSLPHESRKKPSGIKNITHDVKKRQVMNTSRSIFSSTTKPEGRKSDASAEVSRLPDRAPCLSQMKRFASSRDGTLSKFDWTTQVAPEDDDHVVKDHRRYYSDDERGYSDGEEEEEEEVIIPFSAPLTVGGVGPRVALEPRKEINLWKRRTMAKPMPLQVNTSG